MNQHRLILSISPSPPLFPGILDNVMVDAYGSTAPLSSLGQVVQTNARTLTVNVFDPSVSKAVADALRNADMDLNPVDDNGTIKVPLPAVTAETRQNLVKSIGGSAEEGKKALRNIRRDSISEVKKNVVSEDESFALQKDVRRG
jgi:ribosome recycling factor